MASWSALLAAGLAAAACAPKLRPLTGAPSPVRLPRAELPAGYRRVVFTWELRDPDFLVRGEGVARLAPPDSARLDFFVGGGLGGGRAVLIGQSVLVPGGDFVRRLIPPAPLLWAALGRLALPAAADTTVRVDNGMLRADVGAPPAWRVTFRGDTLVRLDRVAGDRVTEWVERSTPTRVRYRHETARRDLTLVVDRIVEEASPFDATIWRP
ncbi:MAG: hypothetical protein ABR499_06815 [Gemmatimonadaceae bacterium]